jgi:chemotaxis protein methyltransferase CheR
VSQTFPRITVSSQPETRGLRIPERTLPLLRDLVATCTGMYYEETRLDFLRDRLAPLALERGFDSMLDYYYLLKYDADAEAEWVRAIDALSVQETYFWREFDQIEALVGVIVPALAERGRNPIRIWSVPCATGEEPLSIAMALTEAGWFSRMTFEIHAGDASQAALTRARAGRYGARAFRRLPEDLKRRYFRQSSDSEWVVAPEIHQRVSSWTELNMVSPTHTSRLTAADVVFCRNLFIYFAPSTVQRVVDELADRMASPGYLCVGAAESLLRLTTRFELQDLGGAYVYMKP